MTKNPRAPDNLPGSISDLLNVVDILEDTLFDHGTPMLSQIPATDQAVETAVRGAAAWAAHVRRAYGAGERQRRYKGAGILPFFAAGSGFDAHDDDPVTLLGALPDEFTDARRVGADLTVFEYSFHRFREPSLSQALSLTNPSARNIEFTVDNWDEIRQRLRAGHARVMKRALGIAAWVRTKVQELDAAAAPRVQYIGEGSHSRVLVRVSQGGASREVEIPNSHAVFLHGLGSDGVATTARRTKKDLLERIHELRPWIENHPRQPSADIANEATYHISVEVRALIEVPKP